MCSSGSGRLGKVVQTRRGHLAGRRPAHRARTRPRRRARSMPGVSGNWTSTFTTPYRRVGAPRWGSTTCSIHMHRPPSSGMWIGCGRKSAPIRTDAPACMNIHSNRSWRASRSHGAWAFKGTNDAKRRVVARSSWWQFDSSDWRHAASEIHTPQNPKQDGLLVPIIPVTTGMMPITALARRSFSQGTCRRLAGRFRRRRSHRR